MYYEVYADVLFVKNFWMDFLLLLVTAWAGRIPIRLRRILMAAVLGGAGSCVLTVMSAKLNGAGYFLGTLMLAAVMTWAAYPGRRYLGERILSVYLEGLLLGGMVQYLEQFHRLAGIWFLGLGTMAALLVLAGEAYRKYRRHKAALTCKVMIKHGQSRVQLEALYDTGNSLRDPVSGRPVSILEKNLLQMILRQSGRENLPRVIPYRTISQEGLLEAYTLEEMEVECPDGIRLLKKPLVACMPGETGRYQMILHRDLLSS